jgi:hypothetical protein
MRKNVLVGILLGAIALASAGCNTVNQAVGESMALGAPEQDIEAELALYRNYFAPEQVMRCLALARATPERRSCRDLITYARMRYIDLRYALFRQRVFAEVNGANTATDITVLGLNAAGTLVGGATTKSILAAISGGLVGAKGIINKDVLYNAQIQTLILKMDADRTAVRLRITNNLKQNEEVYPFEAAELDTGDYYRVGTIADALITLEGNAAATLSYDTNVINNSVPQAPAASPPGIAAAPPPPPALPPPPPVPAPPPTPPPAQPAVVAPPPIPPPPVVIPPAPPVVFPPPPPRPSPAMPGTVPPPMEPRIVHGLMPDNVQSALRKMVKFVLDDATPEQVNRASVALGLPPGSGKRDVRQAINKRVNDPARADRQMKDLSDLLREPLGRSFFP